MDNNKPLIYLNRRQKEIIDFVHTNQPIKLGDLTWYITDVTIHTLKKDLQYLKKHGFIQSSGHRKGTIYFV